MIKSSLATRSFQKRWLSLLVALIFLATPLLTLIPISGGSNSEGGIDTRAAGNTPMGDWLELPSGGWPSLISSGSCDIMYRENEKELVVFADNPSGFTVWSYFENNNTWKSWITTGPAPATSFNLRAFTTDPVNDVAYFFGGSQGWNLHDK